MNSKSSSKNKKGFECHYQIKQHTIRFEACLFDKEVIKVIKLNQLLAFSNQKNLTWCRFYGNHSNFQIFCKYLISSEAAERLSFRKMQIDNFYLFKQINILNFPNLIRLDLYNAKITNIQALIFINCPLLQRLNLSHNQLCSIQTFLDKYSYQRLKYLCIHQNKIINYNFSKSCSKKISQGTLCLINLPSQTIQNEDISIFSKIYGEVSEFQSFDYKRIERDKVEKLLQKRFMVNIAHEIEEYYDVYDYYQYNYERDYPW